MASQAAYEWADEPNKLARARAWAEERERMGREDENGKPFKATEATIKARYIAIEGRIRTKTEREKAQDDEEAQRAPGREAARAAEEQKREKAAGKASADAEAEEDD